jgi:hypothetical protein
MHIFTDESGQFNESLNSEWAIMVICSITDKELQQFSEYYTGLFGNQWSTVKASQLELATRKKLIKYISKHDEIRYTAIVYDFKSTSENAISQHKAGQLMKIEEAIEKTRPIAKYPSLITDLELLRNQIRNLSSCDYLKVIMTYEAYRDWMQTFPFDYFYTNWSRDSWILDHVFDMQSTPGKYIRIFYNMLYLTTNSLAGANFPLYLPQEWPMDHPLFKKYHTEEGTDMRKMLENRRCGDDKQDIGLKLPDLISNTLLRSIQRQNEIAWLKILNPLKGNRSYVHKKDNKPDFYKIIAFRGGLDNVEPSSKISTHAKLMWDLSCK